MKKTRIFLTAIAVLAVVGGALAFKARTFVAANVYCSTFSSNPICRLAGDISGQDFQTTVVSGAQTKNPCSNGYYFTESGCNTTYTTSGTGGIPVYDKQPL